MVFTSNPINIDWSFPLKILELTIRLTQPTYILFQLSSDILIK